MQGEINNDFIHSVHRPINFYLLSLATSLINSHVLQIWFCGFFFLFLS